MLSASTGLDTGPFTYVGITTNGSSQWICLSVFHRSPRVISQKASGQRNHGPKEALCESRLQG